MLNPLNQPHCAVELQTISELNGIDSKTIIVTGFQPSMDSQLVDASVLINAFLGEHSFHQKINLEVFCQQFSKNLFAWTDSDNDENRIDILNGGELLDEKFIEAMYVVGGKLELPIISFELTLECLFNAFLSLDFVNEIKNANIDLGTLEKNHKPIFHIVQTFAKWIENGHKSISTEMFESLNDSYFSVSRCMKSAS